MSEAPVIETILNITDGQFGLRYLKIVKSPSMGHYVLDIMFAKGLRLTTDVVPGEKSSQMKEDLLRKLRTHRSSEYDIMAPVIKLVTDCATRALSDHEGRIVARALHEKTLKEVWEEQSFYRWLCAFDPKHKLSFEQALDVLEPLYPNQECAAST